eukprot:3605031-Pyramimonas_sp.AAC.1
MLGKLGPIPRRDSCRWAALAPTPGDFRGRDVGVLRNGWKCLRGAGDVVARDGVEHKKGRANRQVGVSLI